MEYPLKIDPVPSVEDVITFALLAAAVSILMCLLIAWQVL